MVLMFVLVIEKLKKIKYNVIDVFIEKYEFLKYINVREKNYIIFCIIIVPFYHKKPIFICILIFLFIYVIEFNNQ